MDIVFVRHGIAEDGGPDDLRALTSEGREKVSRMGLFLNQKLSKVDLILSSPLVRAVETADVIASRFPGVLRDNEDALHHSSLPDETLATLAARCVTFRTVICVGHEPNASAVISLALSGHYGSFVRMKKGAAASISFDGVPSRGRGILNWFVSHSVVLSASSCVKTENP